MNISLEKTDDLEKSESYTIKVQEFNSTENDPFIMVLITPLMKRVHEKVVIKIYHVYLHNYNKNSVIFLDYIS